MVASNAAIAVTKLALGSANTVLTSDGATNSFSTTTGANARVAIKNNGGAVVGTRRTLNVIPGSGITVTTTDDNAGEKVDITIASTVSSALTIQKDGSTIASRPTVNFITGTGTALTVADNSGSNRVDVTVKNSISRGTNGSVPGSPANGDEFYLQDATYPNVWHIKWNSSNSRWEVVGGTPAYVNAGATTIDYSGGSGWRVGTSYSVPRAGLYQVQFGGVIAGSGNPDYSNSGNLGIAVNGAGSASGKQIVFQGTSYYGQWNNAGSQTENYSVTVGQTIKMAYYAAGGSNNWSTSFQDMWFTVMPIYFT